MRKIQHILEYVLLRSLVALIDVLPIGFADVLARRLADIWYLFNASRRNTAIENIIRSGIAGGRKDSSRIARASFRHFAVLVVESLKLDSIMTRDNWKEKAQLDFPDETMRVLEEEGQGVLLVSGHLGNWEIAARLLSYIKPVTAITRELNNPYSNRLILRRKSRGALTLTPKHDADGSRFLNVLKKGEVLALLNDQHARDRGMDVDFFGVPAKTHTAVALLHYITGAPICFGYCVRTGRMSFRMKALKPMKFSPTGNRAADIRKVLETLNSELEKAIRAYPEQYLWAHRRWK